MTINIKTNPDGFCQEFYNSYIFPTPTKTPATRVVSLYWDSLYDNIVAADPSFSSIGKDPFQREFKALHLELFGFAWLQILKDDKFTFPNSVFTRRYLETNNLSEYWIIMGEYNKAIAESVTLNRNGKEVDGKIGQAQITFFNEMRAKLFYKWCKENENSSDFNYQAQCIARVLNRIGADTKRADSILIRKLTARWRTGLDAAKT
jgi:hypothetical protein